MRLRTLLSGTTIYSYTSTYGTNATMTLVHYMVSCGRGGTGAALADRREGEGTIMLPPRTWETSAFVRSAVSHVVIMIPAYWGLVVFVRTGPAHRLGSQLVSLLGADTG